MSVHASPDHTAAQPRLSKPSRIAIVTGGSRGIGRQAVRRLAADGYALVVGYSGSPDQASAAVNGAITGGSRAIAVQADIANEHAVEALFDAAEAEFGGIDVVVHAAGRTELAPIAELDLSVLDDLHRTNIRGTFVVAQQAARRVRRGGSILTFSTSVVGLAFPAYGAYAASKGAVEALTLILARELRGRDVTVNAVAPGPTAAAAGQHPSLMGGPVTIEDIDHWQTGGCPVVSTRAFGTVAAGTSFPYLVGSVGDGLVDTAEGSVQLL
ncbi:SDR family NAD(P)-dependent oxidoreductase [Streptomyces tendae]|uniref:SDR family NAD(P)-dependent oxidoreductase n=1 Tax=Streptomyces tendae TaxID=1932 RepID=UPI0037214C4D